MTDLASAPDSVYVPGTCNIGGAEIRMRRRVGWIGAALTVIVAAVVLVLRAYPAWMLLAAIPTYVGAIGMLQARAGFCVGYAAARSYGFGSSRGTTGTVEDDEAYAADRARARQINAQAARATILVAAILIALAVLVR